MGRRVALALRDDHDVVLVGCTRRPEPIAGVRCVVGAVPNDVEVNAAVVATRSNEQLRRCKVLIDAGIDVVSTAGNVDIVERLWALGPQAASHGATLVVGAAYSPGLSGLLAGWLIGSFVEVFDVEFARFGTGGPACAREHHRAAKITGRSVVDGELRRTRPGTGRTLVWFPGDAGGADCYHGAHSDPFLLHQAAPEIPRILARMAATRRDRLTAWLPMLRRPHPEGLVGALTVEVRGRSSDGGIEHRVVGATAPQATGAAVVAALMVNQMVAGALRVGVQSVYDVADPGAVLGAGEVDLGLSTYDGSRISFEADSPIQVARPWQFGGK